MTNYKLIEKFFEDYKQKGNSEYYSKQYGSLRYVNNVLYSYATCIGEIVKDIRGGDILLISDEIFSPTTSKHLRLLASIARNKGLKPIRMVGLYNADEFDPRDIIACIIERFKSYAQTKVSRECYRAGVVRLYRELEFANNIEKFVQYKDKINELLAKYADLYKLAIQKQKKLLLKRLSKDPNSDMDIERAFLIWECFNVFKV